MRTGILSIICALLVLSPLAIRAADHLQLNQKLDYDSDSQDGPLITGEHMDKGVVPGQPNYVIIYGEGCFNSKRQARRTVDLYEKYKGRVNFVVVDLDQPRSPEQAPIIRSYYGGAIPHVVVFDQAGKPVYNEDGEVSSERLEQLFERLLMRR